MAPRALDSDSGQHVDLMVHARQAPHLRASVFSTRSWRRRRMPRSCRNHQLVWLLWLGDSLTGGHGHVLGDGPEWQAAGLRWGARNEADEDPRQIQASERTRRDGDAPRRLQADDPPRKFGDLAATGQVPKSRPARGPQGGPLTSSPKAFGLSRRPAVAQAVR